MLIKSLDLKKSVSLPYSIVEIDRSKESIDIIVERHAPISDNTRLVCMVTFVKNSEPFIVINSRLVDIHENPKQLELFNSVNKDHIEYSLRLLEDIKTNFKSNWISHRNDVDFNNVKITIEFYDDLNDKYYSNSLLTINKI